MEILHYNAFLVRFVFCGLFFGLTNARNDFSDFDLMGKQPYDDSSYFGDLRFPKYKTQNTDCKTRQYNLPIIPTNYGKLRGKRFNIDMLCPVVQFLGVPYSKPPIGDRRWQKPEDPNTWDGVRDAFTMGPICPQKLDGPFLYPLLPAWFQKSSKYMKKMSKNMSEDCLYMNIYVPLEFYYNESHAPGSYKNRLAVMVYIHGHTFMEGSGNFYDGSVLASYGKVIVITFNYRLGALGFLSTSNQHSPGNYGLWDQIKALEWIYKNIEHFGGDKTRVTLFGSGSGAASISLLMVSVHVEDYFQQIILQSGTALSSWTIVQRPMTQTRLFSQHPGINCASNSSGAELMDCLRKKHWSDILAADLQPEMYNLAFGPVVDGSDGVLSDEPEELMKSGEYMNYPMIIGVSQGDGYGLVRKRNPVGIMSAFEVTKRVYDQKDFKMDVDKFVDGFYRRAGTAKGILRRIIEFMYTDWTRESDERTLRRSLLDLYTDRQWVEPVVRTANMNLKLGYSVYFYTLFHRAGIDSESEWMDAGHGDELPFVFGYPFYSGQDVLFGYNFTKTDRMISAGIMTYWTNFAKERNPMLGNKQKTDFLTGVHNKFQDLDWPKYDKAAQKYLMISKKPAILDHYRANQVAFWNTFLPNMMEAEKIFPSQKSTTWRPAIATPPTTKKSTDKPIIWSPIRDALSTMSPNSSDESNKADGGMSLRLTITLAIGFVLLFVNIIAFSVVSYHKKKDKFKIEKLEAQLAEKNDLFKKEMKKVDSNGDDAPSGDNKMKPRSITNCHTNPEISLDAAVLEKSNHALCAYTLPHRYSHTKSPTRAMSTTALPQLKPCVFRDDSLTSTSAEEQSRNTKRRSFKKYGNTYHSSDDGSPASMMVCNSKEELSTIHPPIPEFSLGMKKGDFSTESGGRYSLQTTNSATPDHHRAYKTYNGKQAVQGTVRLNVVEPPGEESNRPTSLWSIVSSVADGRSAFQRYGLETTTRAGHHGSESHMASSSAISQVGESYAYAIQSDSQKSDVEINDTLPVEGGYLARDLSCGSKSALLTSPIEKPCFRSDTSGSETDRTGSSSRSDAIGSYCVTNNKTMNVITKL
uniref:neuroligin-4, Y-linked-like n=1 Tax=Styela clava TaxID=7725 RepID=UPI001939F164|nr:neuroligin-4, Y-linked-like [Styela clava]